MSTRTFQVDGETLSLKGQGVRSWWAAMPFVAFMCAASFYRGRAAN